MPPAGACGSCMRAPCFVMSQASSHASRRRRAGSASARGPPSRDGCRSTEWRPCPEAFQSELPRRKRRTRSASEQATRKYSCTNRSPCPTLVESSGIEDPRERFGGERLGQRAHEIAAAEFLKIEEIGRGGRPQTERVDGLAAVADNRPIERNSDQSWTDGRESGAASRRAIRTSSRA